MEERKIKDLAIALEALSRIGGRFYTDEHMNSIERLINNKLKILKAEIEPPKPTNLDDEIPF